VFEEKKPKFTFVLGRTRRSQALSGVPSGLSGTLKNVNDIKNEKNFMNIHLKCLQISQLVQDRL